MPKINVNQLVDVSLNKAVKSSEKFISDGAILEAAEKCETKTQEAVKVTSEYFSPFNPTMTNVAKESVKNLKKKEAEGLYNQFSSF